MKKIFTLFMIACSTIVYGQYNFELSGNIVVNGAEQTGETIHLYLNQEVPSIDSTYYSAISDGSGDYSFNIPLGAIEAGTYTVSWFDCYGDLISRTGDYSISATTFVEDFECNFQSNLYVSLSTKTNGVYSPFQSVSVQLYTPNLTQVDTAYTDSLGFYNHTFSFNRATAGNAVVTWHQDCQGNDVSDTIAFDTQGVMQIGKNFDCFVNDTATLNVEGMLTRNGSPASYSVVDIYVRDANQNTVGSKVTTSLANGVYFESFAVSSSFVGSVESVWWDSCDSIAMTKTTTVNMGGNTNYQVNHSFACEDENNGFDSLIVDVVGWVMVDGSGSYPDDVRITAHDNNNNTHADFYVNTMANGRYETSFYLPGNFVGTVYSEWLNVCTQQYEDKNSYVDGSTQVMTFEHSFSCENDSSVFIYGYVFEDDSMVADLAEVYLFKKAINGNRYEAVDTFYLTPNYNGRYEFEVEIGEKYLTKAAPISESGYLPTYHTDWIRWNQANVIEPNTSNNYYNIFLIDEADADGNGSAHGNVSEEDRAGLPFNWMTAVMTDMNDMPLYTSEVDEFGDFLFSDLPYGDYKIFIDYPGFPCEARTIRIDEENQHAGNADFKVGEESISLGLASYAMVENNFKMFPNPAKNILTISMEKNTTATVTLMDNMGKTFKMEELKGKQLTLDISNIPSGIYSVKITTNNFTTAKQVVKY